MAIVRRRHCGGHRRVAAWYGAFQQCHNIIAAPSISREVMSQAAMGVVVHVAIRCRCHSTVISEVTRGGFLGAATLAVSGVEVRQPLKRWPMILVRWIPQLELSVIKTKLPVVQNTIVQENVLHRWRGWLRWIGHRRYAGSRIGEEVRIIHVGSGGSRQ